MSSAHQVQSTALLLRKILPWDKGMFINFSYTAALYSIYSPIATAHSYFENGNFRSHNMKKHAFFFISVLYSNLPNTPSQFYYLNCKNVPALLCLCCCCSASALLYFLSVTSLPQHLPVEIFAHHCPKSLYQHVCSE